MPSSVSASARTVASSHCCVRARTACSLASAVMATSLLRGCSPAGWLRAPRLRRPSCGPRPFGAAVEAPHREAHEYEQGPLDVSEVVLGRIECEAGSAEAVADAHVAGDPQRGAGVVDQ